MPRLSGRDSMRQCESRFAAPRRPRAAHSSGPALPRTHGQRVVWGAFLRRSCAAWVRVRPRGALARPDGGGQQKQAEPPGGSGPGNILNRVVVVGSVPYWLIPPRPDAGAGTARAACVGAVARPGLAGVLDAVHFRFQISVVPDPDCPRGAMARGMYVHGHVTFFFCLSVWICMCIAVWVTCYC